MYEVIDENNFNIIWDSMISNCFPKGPHRWLHGIHSLRQQWSSAWTRQHFTAGMRSTQLSESLNSTVKRFLQPDDNIVQFFNHFDRVMVTQREREEEQDFNANDRLIFARHLYNPLMKSAAEVYTPNVFQMFSKQQELGQQYVVNRVEPMKSYLVYHSDIFDDQHLIQIDLEELLIDCTCKKWENIGILCCHAIRLMEILGGTECPQLRTIPERYILNRWRKDARKMYRIQHHNLVVDRNQMDYSQRYRSLCHLFMSSASVIASDKSNYEAFVLKFKDILKSTIHNSVATVETLTGDICIPIEAGNLILKPRENPKGRIKRKVSISNYERQKKCKKLNKKKRDDDIVKEISFIPEHPTNNVAI